MSKKEGNIAGLYDIEKNLGKGHFAVVMQAKHVFSGDRVALKIIEKNKLDDHSKKYVYHEIRCLKLIKHPYVVKLIDVLETSSKMFLVLELADGGDLENYMFKYGKFSEPKARKYFRQLVSAICYCHSIKVCHRDLKPENIVYFSKHDCVKITDFGFGNSFNNKEKFMTACGSLAYTAPEVLIGDKYYGTCADVWSLGVILYKMVHGDTPFYHANSSEMLSKILDVNFEMPGSFPEELKDILKKIIVKQPDKRMSVDKVMNHQWLSVPDSDEKTIELNNKELEISPMVHSLIIQNMEKEKISTKEEIESYLNESISNNISSTYYLMVNKYLSEHQNASTLYPTTHKLNKSNSIKKCLFNRSPSMKSLHEVPEYSNSILQSSQPILTEEIHDSVLTQCQSSEITHHN